MEKTKKTNKFREENIILSVILEKDNFEDIKKLSNDLGFKTPSKMIRYLINKEMALQDKFINTEKSKVINMLVASL